MQHLCHIKGKVVIETEQPFWALTFLSVATWSFSFQLYEVCCMFRFVLGTKNTKYKKKNWLKIPAFRLTLTCLEILSADHSMTWVTDNLPQHGWRWAEDSPVITPSFVSINTTGNCSRVSLKNMQWLLTYKWWNSTTIPTKSWYESQLVNM